MDMGAYVVDLLGGLCGDLGVVVCMCILSVLWFLSDVWVIHYCCCCFCDLGVLFGIHTLL